MAKAKGCSRRATALAALILAAACLFPAGCGKKEWPSPRTEKDRFSWASVRAGRDGSCLVIRGELEGAVQNLKEVVLRLETSKELCPGCPFTPNSSAAYSLSDPSLIREGGRVIITHCPVEPDSAVRLRLEGVNVFQQIQPAVSDVVEMEAQNATRSQP
jgi:hypothetical protein